MYIFPLRCAALRCAALCRSPTVVIYYLMRHRGWRLSEAYNWVKDRRPSINIGAGEARWAGRGLSIRSGPGGG